SPHLVTHSFPTRRSSDLKSAGPSFLQDVHRSSGVALLNNKVAFSKLNSLEFLDYFSKRGSRQSPEITEFVEETLQCPRASRHLRSEEHTSELQSLAYLVC